MDCCITGKKEESIALMIILYIIGLAHFMRSVFESACNNYTCYIKVQ
jgi:hypothetical protein